MEQENQKANTGSQPQQQTSGVTIREEAKPPQQKQSPPKEKKRSKAMIYFLNSLGLLAVLAGLYWIASLFFHFNKVAYTNDAQVEQYITPINTRVAGYIKEIRFTEHEQVKKGDTLVIIDDSEFKIQLAQAEANYQDAMANKTVINSGISTSRNNLSVSDANIQEAKARLWNAEQNYKRYKNLLQEDVVTGQQYDQVKTEYDAAKARVDALQNQKRTTQLGTEEISTKLGVNEAAIKRAAAAVDMARLNLKYTVITAPYDGVTGRRVIQEGQLVQAGQSLLSLVISGQIWVVANYKETQTEHLHIGQLVKIKVDAISHKEYEGKITAMSEATGAKYSTIPIDNSTGNFVKIQQRIPVRIDFTENNKQTDIELLRAGMNVEVEEKLK